ncbi:M56 family metallopeptidase [Oscillibacter sp.]|uniref:M56 family metallopeptidase n=1 Tax=Oscillibacter sp. TaxID=1945593 RepID=UPI00289F29E6|nr:M56 family metallopeptidase [Oscillibacter sp.]
MITEYSLVMSALWGTIILASGAFLTKSKWFIQRFGISGFLVVMLTGTARLLFPLEFPHTLVLRDTVLMPFLVSILRGEVFSQTGVGITYGQLILAVWGAGTSLYLAILIGSMIRQQKRISRLCFSQSKQYNRILHELQGGDRCKILVSEEIASPVLIGLFHPCILMPDVTISDGQAQFVLQHELQHYLHGDLWKKILCAAFCAAFWWNPLTYMIWRKLDYILELNCDRRVVEAQSEEKRIEYAEATLCILKQVKSRKKTPYCSVAFANEGSSGQLAKRCELILYPPRASWLKPVLLPALVGLLVLSYTFVLQPYSPLPPDDYIQVTSGTSYLQENADGTYTLIINGENWGEVLPKDFDMPPYNELTIHKK